MPLPQSLIIKKIIAASCNHLKLRVVLEGSILVSHLGVVGWVDSWVLHVSDGVQTPAQDMYAGRQVVFQLAVASERGDGQCVACLDCTTFGRYHKWTEEFVHKRCM